MGEKVQTAILPQILEEMKIRVPWYHFNDIQNQMWLEIDRNIIPKRDPIVEKLSSKLKNSTPQETKDFSEDVDVKLTTSIQESLKHWKLDSSPLYLHSEGRLRETAMSFNGKILKLLCHISVKIAATPPTLLHESRTYATNKGVTITAVPVNSITIFWLQ